LIITFLEECLVPRRPVWNRPFFLSLISFIKRTFLTRHPLFQTPCLEVVPKKTVATTLPFRQALHSPGGRLPCSVRDGHG
jgi:hypothetical protein